MSVVFTHVCDNGINGYINVYFGTEVITGACL